jgi:hypothetical protein
MPWHRWDWGLGAGVGGAAYGGGLILDASGGILCARWRIFSGFLAKLRRRRGAVLMALPREAARGIRFENDMAAARLGGAGGGSDWRRRGRKFELRATIEKLAQNGARREAVPGPFGGARRTLCGLAGIRGGYDFQTAEGLLVLVVSVRVRPRCLVVALYLR